MVFSFPAEDKLFNFVPDMGFFDRLFGKKEKLLPPLDLALVGTDMHSHFIPGIDDGAKEIEDSLNLLRGMESLGYSKVYTTPHVMSDYYRNTPEIILSGLEELRHAAKKEGIQLRIEAAAEYYLDMEFQKLIANKSLLTIGDNYVLFELPFLQEPPQLNEAIFEMQLAGYKPILAHPERYAYWHMDLDKYQAMLDKGVILQLNINSLTGHYSPQVKKIAEKLIDAGMVQMIGTDCHHPGHLELLNQAIRLQALHDLVKNGNLINKEL